MKSGHRFEEYMKRIMIVKRFQSKKNELFELKRQATAGEIGAAETLRMLLRFVANNVAPMTWMSD